MKYNSNIEVILLSSASFTNLYDQKLLNWLTTTAQAIIVKQHETTKKLFVRTLRSSPAIYLS